MVAMFFVHCDRTGSDTEVSHSSGVGVSDTLTLKVMATADVHGRVRAWDYYRDQPQPRYAFSKAATLIDSIRSLYPNHLLLDSGDWLQGNPFAEYFAQHDPQNRHYPFLQVVDDLEYDAIVLGNHEFNFGLDYLNRQIEMTQTPVLGGNIYKYQTEEPAYTPYVIREVDGIRIAIIGLTTPGSAVWDRSHVEGVLDFGQGPSAAERLVTQAKEEDRADLVVVLAHSGLDGESSYHREDLGTEHFGRAVGEQVAGVDLLVLGHTHRAMDGVTLEGPDGGDVAVVQPGRWASTLGVASLETVRHSDGTVEVIDHYTRNYSVEDVKEHPGVVQMTEQAHQEVVEFVTEPIAETADHWTAENARRKPTPIIDLINEVQMEVTGAELSAAAAFVTSVSFGPGPITRGDINLLYPYYNTLYKLEISGAQLREFLEYTSQYYLSVSEQHDQPEVNPDWAGFNYDMVSGVEYVLDLREDAGQRVTLLEYNGRPVSNDDLFTIAINSYRAEGGGGFEMLENARVIEHIDRSVGDMILEYLQQKREIGHEDVYEDNWQLAY